MVNDVLVVIAYDVGKAASAVLIPHRQRISATSLFDDDVIHVIGAAQDAQTNQTHCQNSKHPPTAAAFVLAATQLQYAYIYICLFPI